jgi:hypothetical protein
MCPGSVRESAGTATEEDQDEEDHEDEEDDMRLSWMVWSVMVSCILALVLPPAAFAEGPIKNGLSSKAFRRNALTTNQKALKILMSHPLDEGLFSGDLEAGYLGLQLQDPSARAVMEEMVKCALNKGATVTYGVSTWKGELGLCQPKLAVGSPNQDPPSWGPSGPNVACQQLVTACLTARTNALRKAIPLSLRGQSSVLFPLHDAVSTETTFRESPPGEDPSEGTPIGSFNGPVCLQGHECGWAPAYVGTCKPGDPIQLAIQDPSACGSSMLRVCDGIHGCLGTNSGYQVPDGFPQPPYSQWNKDKAGACTSSPLSFLCPTSVALSGSYSVMTRSIPLGKGVHDSRSPSPIVIKAIGSATYPATEKQIFTFREGAFYGNLFEPDELSWNCEVGAGKRTCNPILPNEGAVETCDIKHIPGDCVTAKTVPYRNVYACFSLAQQQDTQGNAPDDDGVAYLNDRICDEPDPSKPCFFHPPRRCYFQDPATNQARGAHCDWVGDGVYQNCKSLDGKNAYLPITTYLNDPCDLIGNHAVCSKLRRYLAKTGSTATVAPRPRGCSAGGAGGGLLPASAAALVAFLRSRRTRRRAG